MNKEINDIKEIGIKKIAIFTLITLVIVASLVLIFQWISTPSYSMLSDSIPEQSKIELLSSLSQRGADYKIDPSTGNVLVKTEQLAELRQYVMDLGIPIPTPIGMELFDKGDYGMSEFAQKINFQRAIEGELSRTIQLIDGVRVCRVHLAPAKESVFESKRQQAKASVSIQMVEGRRLTESQVIGIQNLVASSVTAMSAEDVIIIDQYGRNLTANDQFRGTERLTLIKEMESDYESRINKLIATILNDTAFSSSVRIELSLEKRKTSIENPIPSPNSTSGFLVKKTERKESPPTPAGNDSNLSYANSSSEFIFGKQYTESEELAGKIDRIHVAVAASAPINEEMIAAIRATSISALGLNEKRGDSISVVASKGASESSRTVINEKKEGEGKAKQNDSESSIAKHSSSIATAQYDGYTISFISILINFVLLITLLARGKKSISKDQKARIESDLRAWLSDDASEHQNIKNIIS